MARAGRVRSGQGEAVRRLCLARWVLEPGPGLRRLRWGAGSPVRGGSRLTRAWGGGDTHECPCPRAPNQRPWPPCGPPPAAIQAQLIRTAPLEASTEQRQRAPGGVPGALGRQRAGLRRGTRGATLTPLRTPWLQSQGAQKTCVSGPYEQANSRLAPRLHLTPVLASRPRQVTTSPGGAISQAGSTSWERAGLAGFSAAVAGCPLPRRP